MKSILPQIEKQAIAEPLETLFAGLSQSIDASNAGLVLPTSDELYQDVPRVRIVGDMFRPK